MSILIQIYIYNWTMSLALMSASWSQSCTSHTSPPTHAAWHKTHITNSAVLYNRPLAQYTAALTMTLRFYDKIRQKNGQNLDITILMYLLVQCDVSMKC